MKTFLMLLGVYTSVFSESFQPTYVTDSYIKDLLVRSFDPPAYDDDICKGSLTRYDNVKLKFYLNDFALTAPVSVKVQSNKIIAQRYAGMQILTNKNAFGLINNIKPFYLTVSESLSIATTSGWSGVPPDISGNFVIPRTVGSVSFPFVISESTISRLNTYTSPTQSVLISEDSIMQVDAFLNIAEISGYYEFDADVTGTALLSYDASCNGKKYPGFFYGPIAGFLYYRNRNQYNSLPSGLTFIGNPEKGLKLRVHSRGKFHGTFANDFFTYFTLHTRTSPLLGGIQKHSSPAEIKTLKVSPIIKANKPGSKLDSSAPLIISPPKGLFNLAPSLFGGVDFNK